MEDPAFQRGEIDVTYVERLGSGLLGRRLGAELVRPLAVVAALLAEERRTAAQPETAAARSPDRPTAWVVEGRREGLREGLRE
jgi:hypothetical protein